MIQENADMVALAPYAPRFAFETWMLPKRHGARFEEAPRHEYESLARLLKAMLQRMDRALEPPPYNLVIHTAPFSEDVGDVFHWHIEIMPKITRVAGFEWGTGFYINPTPPEEAAQVLRRQCALYAELGAIARAKAEPASVARVRERRRVERYPDRVLR